MASDHKINDYFEIEWSVKASSRRQLRDATVNKFLGEKSGYWRDGIKHVTNFKYFVEKLTDGRRIFLLRPTFLNKGIDFQVWVEKFDGTQDKRPSHRDMFEDLTLKKEENESLLGKLLEAIDSVWACTDPDDVLTGLGLHFESGFSVEMILKVLKWLFIDQDVTYWNYDGRGMLRMAINEKLDVKRLSETMKKFFEA